MRRNCCWRTYGWFGPISPPTATASEISRIILRSQPGSTARRMRSPVVDLLADVASALDTAGVPWYLFGAQAAILHGAVRLTADVDVTVRLPDSMSNEALAQTLEQHRFHRRVHDAAFIERTRVIPFVHLPTAFPMDVVLAGPGLEDRFFDRVVIRHIDDVRVRVASAEDLIVMKVLAGRPKDLEDVEAIVAAYGDRLDEATIRTTLELLQQALAQADLVPAFERAAVRARGSR